MQIISIYKRGKLDKLAPHFVRYYLYSVSLQQFAGNIGKLPPLARDWIVFNTSFR